ncbi:MULTISPECIES: DUF1674 domain-containing protein [Methylomonas]|uniref:DUF1674 domain-containing protein n=1 Tax=Methylomonas TaxID=416 RepID=UPI0012321DE3|nr:succinate dehydrogenase assembly factor 4 [Methylomonas rhizoryzae]
MQDIEKIIVDSPDSAPEPKAAESDQPTRSAPGEIDGPKGPEPTRFGDWERKGRCIDF